MGVGGVMLVVGGGGDFTINIFNNLSFIVQFGGFYDVWASAPV